ncbi:cytochrome B561 [Acetobacter nitrogenifigens DSM 23921 = NBRC 105050]|uniref:Cytochrome b n=1 Tax=Acetobacter nitrogenifigens DSM 23921 = NBRC 105050 TaxID=1120919 RepID=A0A511XB92_9PROT|nr:cytochrome b/b6 domain-containing protein [Acetobacter nitrogenifigens]GBQ92824.1 cytochrome B561 [Acetobacter nitrogenifigens DSM 23921 = NBRC 105050]GEN60141.1 cytochrome b [Acetobacter nitrogenifigens DSM 23921 = NBRC 105050]
MPSTLPTSDAPTRYSSALILLHWLSAPLVVAVMALGWVAAATPDDQTGFMTHPQLMFWHKSVGLLILLLTFLRIGVRISRREPVAGGGGKLLETAATISRWLIYIALLVMPVSGYMMAANGHPVSLFGIAPLPSFAKNEARGDIAWNIHSTAQWALYALLLLHLGAAIWHAAIRRNGVILRILPRQNPRT